MWREVLILANSRKRNNRCIAGVDLQTGQWVRPCYGDGLDGVPLDVRRVAGREPRLLDVVRMRLANDGPDQDIQPENRYILDGTWTLAGQALPEEVFQYVEDPALVFYDEHDRVEPDAIRAQKPSERCSLCLLRKSVTYVLDEKSRHRRFRARFATRGATYSLVVTDSEFETRYLHKPGLPPRGDYLLTISLGAPFVGFDWRCYKLVAGVIAL